MEFDGERAGTGTAEWAEIAENICRGCPNDCRYCYAKTAAAKRGQRQASDWAREEFTKRARMTSYSKREGVIMFPTSHDITPFNVEKYIQVAKLMLAAGNQLLIVSKPRLECIVQLLTALEPWKMQILFRFTIGSIDPAVCAFWEPGAPTPAERINSLHAAFAAGYRTSVSGEPILGGFDTAVAMTEAVRPYITDSIWLGKMNKIGERVDSEHAAAGLAIEELQADAEILRLYNHYRHDPLILWKDSVKAVIISHPESP